MKMKKYIEPSIICRIVAHNNFLATSIEKVSFSGDAISASDADSKFMGDIDAEEDEDFGF